MSNATTKSAAFDSTVVLLFYNLSFESWPPTALILFFFIAAYPKDTLSGLVVPAPPTAPQGTRYYFASQARSTAVGSGSTAVGSGKTIPRPRMDMFCSGCPWQPGSV